MNKFVSLFGLSVALFGCANNSNSDGVMPSWVLNPTEYCNKGYICAVGEGRNIAMSYSNARNEIAKQFKVNVKGSFSSAISQTNGKDETKVNDEINEMTDEILSGIKIKETYTDKNSTYYSYAILDKAKIINDLKFEMDEYDTMMLNNLQQKPFKFATTKKLYNQREELNKKYLFLSGRENPKKVSLNDIIKAKDKALVYKIEINDEALDIAKILSAKISENKDKIDNKTATPDRIIKGEVKVEKAYLNVNGFEKYGILVHLESIENDKVVGSFNVERYQTGRAKAQVLEKIKSELSSYIDKNIDSLIG